MDVDPSEYLRMTLSQRAGKLTIALTTHRQPGIILTMRSLLLLAAGAALCVNSLCAGQTTRPALPETQPAATQPATTQVAASTQPAATRPSATTLPSPDSFLPRLGSDAWQQRQAAEQDLVRMGEDARPIIR